MSHGIVFISSAYNAAANRTTIYGGYKRIILCLICSFTFKEAFPHCLCTRKNALITKNASTPPPEIGEWDITMEGKYKQEKYTSEYLYTRIILLHFCTFPRLLPHQPLFIASTILPIVSSSTHHPQGICTYLLYHSSIFGRSHLDSANTLCVSLLW